MGPVCAARSCVMDRLKSSFPSLLEHKKPVDKAAVRVGFFKGEHFDVSFPEHMIIRTMDTPPKCKTRPVSAKDYTGMRHGRMTAISWFRPSRNGGKTVWIARCDCGKYEFRRPARWASHPSPDDDPDRCEHCRRRDVIKKQGNSQGGDGKLVKGKGNVIGNTL